MPVTKGDDRHQFVPWELLEVHRVHRAALSLSSSRRKSKLLANRQSYVAEQRRLIKGAVYLLLFALSHGISHPFQSSSVSPSASFRTGEKHRSSSDYSSDGKKQKTEDKDLASTRYVS